jgi:hypothetical protein
MTSKKRRSRRKQAKQAQNQQAQPQKKTKAPYKRPNRLEKMSRLSFVLLFFVPFILGEVLLYTGGRVISMYIFPVAWVGFWAALLYTNDWSPLIKRQPPNEASGSAASSPE